ncbi:hypothetical protein C2W64_00284 [Brevibacillus laterosporus]|nr:hypothetical protein C2W64_00284 [Brevibacillus laterosporus]
MGLFALVSIVQRLRMLSYSAFDSSMISLGFCISFPVLSFK